MAEPLFSGRKVAQGSALPAGNPNCAKCRLYRRSISTHPGAIGKGEEGVLVVLKSLDMEKEAEKQLRSALHTLNHDLDKDCWRVGAVGCRPRKEGLASGVECCRPAVMTAIKEKQPRKIIAFGNAALESLLGHRWTHEQLGKLTRWRGQRIPDRDLRAWMYVTYSPSYIAKLEKRDKAIANAFKRDLKNAIRHTDIPVSWDYDPEKDVRILTDATEIKKAIRQYRRSGELVSYDYEGTGLKYNAPGHELYTASLATPKLGAVSFPLYPDVIEAWIRFLTSDAAKTAHNMKFEETVGYDMLGVRASNWKLCTMQGAHVLDNRKGTVGIEFQTYTRLGFLPWGMNIKKYFSKRGKSANSINRIKEAPIRSVLLYGGLDSLAQSMLAHLPEYKGLWVR